MTPMSYGYVVVEFNQAGQSEEVVSEIEVSQANAEEIAAWHRQRRAPKERGAKYIVVALVGVDDAVLLGDDGTVKDTT